MAPACVYAQDCASSVSASENAHGETDVRVTIGGGGGACGGTGGTMTMFINDEPYYPDMVPCEDGSGGCTKEVLTRCWLPGSYHVHVETGCSFPVEGGCSVGGHHGHADTDFTIAEHRPGVAASYNADTQTLDVGYNYGDQYASYGASIGMRYTIDDGSTVNVDQPACKQTLGAHTCSIPLVIGCDAVHKIFLEVNRCGWRTDPAEKALYEKSTTIMASGKYCFDQPTCTERSCTSCAIEAATIPCVGLPVNLGSGDAAATIPLFSIGQDPLPLRMALTYHSTLPTTFNPYDYPSIPLGVPWTHTFNQSVKKLSPYRARWFTPTGDRILFDSSAGIVWTPVRPANAVDVLRHPLDDPDHWVLTHINGTVDLFDYTSGRWLSTTDRWGSTLTATYDGGLLSAVTDSEGRQITFVYGGGEASITYPLQGGGISEIHTPDGGVWRFDYRAGLLNEIYDPLHTPPVPWRWFAYEVLHYLTAIHDQDNATLESHEYNPYTHRATSSGTAGNKDYYGIYYDSGNQVRVEHAMQSGYSSSTYGLTNIQGTYYTASIDGPCASCGGGGGETQHFEYDVVGNPARKIDGSGNITEYGVNSFNGELVEKVEAVGTPLARLTLYSYGQANWPSFLTQVHELSATGADEKIRTYSWNANETVLTSTVSGRLVLGGPPVSYTSLTTFDSHHRRVATDGPRTDVSDVTTMTYYPDADADGNRRGRLHTITNALGQTTTFENYDLFGTPRRVINANGVVSESVTDGRGRTTSRTLKAVAGDPNEAADFTSSWTYDATDHLTETVSAGGTRTRFGYERDTNRLTDTIRLDAGGNERERHHVAFTPMGQKALEEDQLCTTPSAACASWDTRRSESYQYDGYDRLTAVKRALPSGSEVRYTYDASGRLRTTQDENHSTPNTTYWYDPLNRLSSVVQSLNGLPVVTEYGYDVQDNLTAVTDPSHNVTTYAYDDFGRMQTQTSPVTGTTLYAYDPSGNLTSTTDANGATTSRSYDALGRVTGSTAQKSGQPSESTGWSYDDATAGHYGIGRLAAMTDPAGSASYSYDRRGLLRMEQKSIDSATYATAYGYDADGNRISMTYPSGSVLTYAFDFANRPYSVSRGGSPVVTATHYLPFGPMSQMTYGNGTTKTFAYDSRYRPSENKLVGPAGTIADYVYAEDAVGNITQLHDAVAPAYDRDFGYDELNRLITANSGSALWGSGSYTYDLMGNMLSSTLGTKTAAMTYQLSTPKLQSVTENGVTRSVTYDPAGNESAVGTSSSAYSPRNHLAAADALELAYDGRGIRVSTAYPTALDTLTADHLTLYPNQSATGTVTLANAAPAGGVIVTLSSSTTAVTVPPSVTVPAGGTTAIFGISRTTAASQPSAATITASSSLSRTLSIALPDGPLLLAVSATPSTVFSGSSTTGTVTLDQVAPAGGAPVLLSASDSSVTVPSSVTIAAGQTTATFTIAASTTAASAVVMLTGTYGGTTTGNVTVRVAQLSAVSIIPATVSSPATASGSVTFDGPVAAASPVTLSSSAPALVSVPAGVTVAAGAVSQTFPVTVATTSAATSVTITASAGDITQTAVLAVGACAMATATAPTVPPGDTVWIDDDLPSGASIANANGYALQWTTAQSATGSQSLVKGYYDSNNTLNLSSIDGLNQSMGIGQSFVAYVLLNACTPPREIRFTFQTNLGPKTIYWGSGMADDASQTRIGNLPATGLWTRLEVPLSQLTLEQRTVTSVELSYLDGQVWFDHIGVSGTACQVAAPAPTIPAGDTVWVEDAFPSGATVGNGWGYALAWTTAQAAAGSASLYKPYYASNDTMSLSAISGLSEPVGIGQSFVAYVLPSSCVPPREIRFTFQTNLGPKTIYWGSGMADDASQTRIGNLPATGVWTRLEVPLSQLTLEQRIVTAVELSYLDGQVWFDHIGLSGTSCQVTAPAPTIPAGDTVWVEDAFPSGVTIGNGWGYALAWTTAQAAAGSASLYKPYYDSNNTMSLSAISGLSEPVGIGQSFVAYVLPSSCVPPREIRFTFQTNLGPKTIYWGSGMADDAGQTRIGNLPATGVWTRLEVPLSQLTLEQRTVTAVELSYLDGQVWFDHIGLSGTSCVVAAPAPTIPAGDTVWVEDALPSGVTIGNGWGYALAWTTAQAAVGSASLYKPYYDSNNTLNLSTLNSLSQPLGAGQSFVAYVLPSSCVPPREIRFTLGTSAGRKTFYWGSGMSDDASFTRIGNLPTAGAWARLEVPLSDLGAERLTLNYLELSYLDGQVWFDHIGLSGTAAATVTGFTADLASPQAAGTAITWTANAQASVPPAQFRFERQDAGVWSEVQAYGTPNTYTWTPGSGDAGNHAVRVSVRNAGSASDAEDTATLSMTITSGSGALSIAPTTLLAARPPLTPFGKNVRSWFQQFRRTPISLSVSVGALAAPRTGNHSVVTARRHSLYTPEMNLMAETAVSTATTPPMAHEYIWFAGQPVAQADIATSTISYTFTDHLGTPILQTDATATVTWRAEYEPYGTVSTLRTGGARHQPLRFPGQEDEGTQREYNVFRWYRGGWGRYTQADPLRSSAVSPYAYVDDNPVNWMDSWGLYKHKPGGPYHPSIPTRCGPEDSCSQLYEKIGEIEKAIQSHNQWIKEHPEDTVHLDELDDWYNARNRCASYIRKNCSTRSDCKVCKKVAAPSALAIAGYIIYKTIELCLAPEIAPFTP